MADLTIRLEKLILSELRLVVYAPGMEDAPLADAAHADAPHTNAPLTDEAIVHAVTVNEELRNLGYTLSPTDLLRLAGSPSLANFVQHFRSLLPEVSAPPMYPDFPLQVMKMDEAEFRLHQLIHYFSTYDLEHILGIEVKRGWLPHMEATEKTESDETLLSAKVLELVPEEKAAITALTRIMQKRERLTLPGRELTVEALAYLEPEDLAGMKVPFKENLTELFDAVLKCAPVAGTAIENGAEGVSEDAPVTVPGKTAPDKRILLWHQFCQHTGDVLKSVNSILPRYRYHLRTSQKRAIVKLLESYPAVDFKANLILSRGKREKNLVVLQFLDYNVYSRSAEHKEAVRTLRNGELRSWEAQAKYLLASKDAGALDYIAKCPGMMLRMISWLLRLGYPDTEIRDRLVQNAGAISPYTVIDILNALDLKEENAPQESIYLAQRKIAEKKREHYLSIINNPEGFFSKYPMATEYVTAELRRLRNFERHEREKIKELDRDFKAACDQYSRSAPYMDRVRAILMDVLRARMEKADTELKGKKVFLRMEEYDLAYCRLQGGKGSKEGGYLPGGMAIRIPDGVRRLRFFVYWNDEKRVDVDLHAKAYDLEGEEIEIGWNAAFNKGGIVHSGDITHSNAAEYIDIDLEAPLRNAEAVIHLYYGKPSFGKIQTCYVGMMAVKKFREKVKLYDPKNCFFTHELHSEETKLSYGYVDVQRRLLFFTGRGPEKASQFAASGQMYRANAPYLSLQKYLEMLCAAQDASFTEKPEEADVILTAGKPAQEKEVSLVDRNFFLGA